jgi:hypothetical protein
MRMRMVLAVGLHFGLLACSQAGDGIRPGAAVDARPDTSACEPRDDPRCQRADERGPLKPAVPAVPDSPIRSKCAQLPTQGERDTCTNRKESTG